MRWNEHKPFVIVFFFFNEATTYVHSVHRNRVPLEDDKARANQDHIMKTAKQKKINK